MEIWKDIKGYEGLYKVSNLGRIKRIPSDKCIKERLLSPHINKNNKYKCIDLYKNSKRKKKLVHRLVGESFIPNTKNNPHINHINSIRDDNRVENLEWVTRSENMKHAYSKGE